MRVNVLHLTSGQREFSCSGPDAFGGCPRFADGVLPCAGHRLELEEPERLRGLHLAVSTAGVACPLRCLLPGA